MLGRKIAIAALILSGVAGAARAAAPPAGPWILTCDMPSSAAPATTAHRVFRIGPRLLQEWRPDDKRFGNNLCASFACAADRDRLEATISSPSLILTVQVDRRTGGATWRTQGASNLARSNGSCTIQPETPAALPR